MADVDLSVAVTSAGVTDAVAQVTALRKAGVVTGQAMRTLASESVSAGREITRIADSARAAGDSLTKTSTAFTKTGVGATSLRAQLQALEKAYAQLGRENVGASPLERLTAGGGPAVAKQIQALREAFNADPVRDLMAVEREEQRVEEQRVALLQKQAIAARELNSALGAKGAATQNVARANEDLANQRKGITQVEQAQIQLTRATNDLAAAELRRKMTPIGVNKASDVLERTRALENEARAIGAVMVAEKGLNDAQEAHASTSNAFQSSFSYFIIAGMAQQAAQAIRDVGAAAIMASSEMERSFADVNRTFDGTSVELGALKQKLYELSTTTPNSFADLAKIAELGNQLGIAAQDIQSFTTTIAQYSTISGQSADIAATAFGQISNLTGLAASQYSNLASSIEYVARTSVATEATIQNTAKEITALASGAGFSAQAIVGLAGTLSSLAIPPERARGSLSLYFGALNKAVAEGGPKLDAFATLTGKTAGEISKLVAANRGQEVFTSFIAGLSQLNTVAKTTALKELGLSTIRVDQTMRALSQNVPLLTNSLAGANTAFQQNSELGRQYAIVQEQLASKITEFQSAVQNAASAVGGALAPAVLVVLEGMTKLLVAFQSFAQTPIGQGVIIFIATIASLALVLTTVIGGLALLKASLVIIPWALTGLSADGALGAIVRFGLGVFGMNAEVKSGTFANIGLASSFKGVGVAAEVGSIGVKTFRTALVSTGVGLALLLVGGLAAALISAGDAAQSAGAKTKEFFGGDTSSLRDGLIKDQQVYNTTGEAIQLINTKVKENKTTTDSWVGALENATGAQVQLGDGTTTTTQHIKNQTIAYGENTKAALGAKLAANKEVQGLFKTTKSNTDLQGLGFDPTKFLKSLTGNPETGGKEYLKRFTKGIANQLGESQSDVTHVLNELASGTNVNTIITNEPKLTGLALMLSTLGPAYRDAKDAADATGGAIKSTAEQAALAAGINNALGISAIGVSDGFDGATSSLTDYQDAIQSGIKGFSDFGTILKQVQDAQDAANKRKGVDGTSTSLINAGAFTKDLQTANSKAVEFFDGIQTLAKNGSTSFATQLAALGPEASGILASSLKLTPEGAAQLEASARFAAFLASDAFKTALNSEMSNSDAAYAQILKGGGNLADVQSYIQAQVAGVGKAWEQAWAIQHPDLPLNVDINAPTADDIALFKAEADGKITIGATVVPSYTDNPATIQGIKTITDKLSGAKITLPASLDGSALSTSLRVWSQNQNATPEQLAAMLNRPGLSASLDSWIAAHGPVKITGLIYPDLSRIPKSVPLAAYGNQRGVAKGGLPEDAPRFAVGGQWGQFRGPGTGTSDSILARVSAGEFINTADSTSFWGPDFFDSLNRKMLPTSFLNLLGAAAGAGGGGPSHVAHVQVIQNNPLTRDPLKQLRDSSEMVASGIWG